MQQFNDTVSNSNNNNISKFGKIGNNDNILMNYHIIR